MTDNQLTAVELKKMYKTDEKEWLDSYRGFPFNISLKNMLSGLVVFPMLLGLMVLPLRDIRLWKIIGISLSISLISYYACLILIPKLRGYMVVSKITGKDLNKTGEKKDKPAIPEAMGIVTCVVFLIDSIITVGLLDIKSDKVLLFMTGLHCIAFMILLGFIDDVVNLKWKFKLILPFVASFALLIVYDGITSIIVPLPVRFIFGKILELGILYKLYFSALTIF